MSTGPAKPDHKLNLSAGAASVLVALTLVGLKLWALQATGALSVAASLADSALDLVVSMTALMAIIYAARPADEDHRFGHTSAEDLAALGQAVLLAGAAVFIGYGAISRLIADEPAQLENEAQGMLVMGISIAVTLMLVLWQRRVVRQTGSKVVAADSLHYVADLIPNIGAMIALGVSSFLAFPQLDSIIALLASAILLNGAYRIGGAAFDALMDRSADAKTLEKLEGIISGWPGLHGFHDLKTRTAGTTLFVQVHIELDGAQTLQQAHDISRALKQGLLEAFPKADVIIHKDLIRAG
ncbi:MAG: cation diffusion facilitator family transporter [Rhodobacteraceae bacterium]|nr:cation diffusion facilitator family transporter [Paracoccaceae bacterium]